MRLGSGPLRVRIDAKGPEAAELLARAKEEGLVLAQAGEAADLVALPALSAVGHPSATADFLPKSPIPFSPRELEILDYLVDGWSNAEIASVLRIGVRTVRFHLGNVYGRLGVSRRGEAVREAIRLGLVRFDV
jgi:DNA-binding CsgD family transcriptional regulator